MKTTLETALPKLSEERLLARLQPPSGKIRVILDTDTFNEIDDQFAVVYALLSPEKLIVEAITAAPFLNARSTSPADGMEKSYDEIIRLLSRLQTPHDGLVFKGSVEFLTERKFPASSPAVEAIIQSALKNDSQLLHVVAIGAITNVASAILLAPEIVDRIVVVWLGGHGHHWPNTREFNLMQDPTAARIIFNCGVPIIQIPCMGVTSHLRTVMPEIDLNVRGKGAIGDYLADTFGAYAKEHFGWSKEIWDMAPIGYLVNPSWVDTEITHSPNINDDLTWSFSEDRHLIRAARYVHRDPIFRDFFIKLGKRTL